MRDQNRSVFGRLVGGLALSVALGATAIVPASPVAASDGDNQVERTDTTYRLLPDEGVVRVASTVNLTNKSKATKHRGPCKSGRGTCTITTRFYFTTWHSFWVPPVAEAVVLGGPKVKPLPVEEAAGGLAYAAKYPKLWNKKGAKQKVTIDFDLPAGTVETSDYYPRIEDGYTFFCWWGMAGDTGSVKAILPTGWERMGTRAGVKVEQGPTGVVLSATRKKDPGQFVDCFEAVDPQRLDRTYLTGGEGKSLVVIESWPGQEAWANDMAEVAAEALPNLEAMLGTPMPYGELRIREVATQSRTYRSADLRPIDGVLGMCEDASAMTYLPSRLARAWIDPQQITDEWLAEGLAIWLSTRAVADTVCSDAVDHPGPGAPDLDDWVEATSSDVLPLASWQQTTACRLVDAGAAVIGDEAMIELAADLINAPVPVGTSHWLAGISRDLPEGLDEFVAALDAAGVDH